MPRYNTLFFIFILFSSVSAQAGILDKGKVISDKLGAYFKKADKDLSISALSSQLKLREFTTAEKLRIVRDSNGIPSFEVEVPEGVQRQLLNEDGTLSGFQIEGKINNLRLRIDNVDGSVDYAGDTTAPAPEFFTTRTDYRITDIRLTYEFDWQARHASVQEIFGLGYITKKRDIRDVIREEEGNIFGLDEEYSWLYAIIGVGGELRYNEYWSIDVRTHYAYAISPKLDVTQTVEIDDVLTDVTSELDVGDTFEVYGRFRINLRPNKRWHFFTSYDHNATFIEEGPKLAVEELNGSEIFQPKSRIHLNTISFGFNYSF